MNTPNKLTVIRILLVPLFFALMLINFEHHLLLALILFVGASLTDLFDGKLARKHNLVTDFGKFLDPLADKMLTTAAFICFIEMHLGYGIAIITFIVLIREFIVTSLRLIISNNGKVLAAALMGKLKTVIQIVSIIMVIFFEYIISFGVLPVFFHQPLRIIYNIFLWASAVLAVVSGIQYIKDNKQYLDMKK